MNKKNLNNAKKQKQKEDNYVKILSMVFGQWNCSRKKINRKT